MRHQRWALSALATGIVFLAGGQQQASAQGIAFAYTSNASTGAVWAPYAFNPSGQAVLGTRTALGQYTVTFNGTNIDAGWVVLVSAFASTGYCNVTTWLAGTVGVQCFGPSGFPADSKFVVQAYQQNNEKKVGFGFAYLPGGSNYSPASQYAYNPSGQGITFNRTATGTYTAFFAGDAANGGIVHVTAYGAANGYCRVTGWNPSAGGLLAGIACANGAGNPVDMAYVIGVIPAGLTPPGVTYAWVSGGNVSGTYSYNPGGTIGITHSTTGHYTLTFNGSDPTLSQGGTVLVSAFGGSAICQVANWGSAVANPAVDVTCNDTGGTNADSNFTVLFIPPQPLVTVTTSSPGITQVTVDGFPGATAPLICMWVPGTQHTINFVGPQNDPSISGKRYDWVAWSDNGAQSHVVNAPSAAATYLAVLKTQFYLAVSQGGPGAHSAGPNGWYDAGSVVTLFSQPLSSNFFLSWSGTGIGSYTGLEPSHKVTMDGPIGEFATFGAAPLSTIRMWCGSDLAYVDTNGAYWYPDTFFAGGFTATYAVGGNIADTADPALYQKERFAASANLLYNLPMANGPVTVRLKFAEIYFTQPGQRVMNIFINGTQVASNFDILASTRSGNAPVDLIYSATVSNFNLAINLVGVTSVPKISAIEVVPVSVLPVAVYPTVARVVGVQGTQQFTANRSVIWSINPSIGTIDSNGLYTRPALGNFTPGQKVVVTATSQTDVTQFARAVVSLGTVVTDTDIGPVNVAGTSSSTPGDGSRTVSGSGDLYGTSDSFRFSYENWTGDGAITARYTSSVACCINPTKAGVMFRASAAPDSPHAFMAIYSGIVGFLEARTTQGGSTSATFGGAGSFWVKLVRQGNLFTGYISAEGVSWIQVGTATISMPSSVLVGFATSSGYGPLHTAVFDNISIDTSPVTVSVDQTLVSLVQGQQAQFTATVLGTNTTNVTWSVAGFGTINPSTGLYTAPASVLYPLSATVTATSVADPTKSATVTVLLGEFIPVRVNAGGPTHIDPLGVFWNADTGSTNGNVYSAGHIISNSQTPYLYQTERFSAAGPLTYTFNVPAFNSYTVRLKFSEIYYTQPGQRVFDVAINGAPVWPGFDIVQAAGGPNLAIDKVASVFSNGVITITLSPITSAPKISAIEITSP